MATNYDIDYNDKRFTKVESEKSAALTEHEKTYNGMINSSDKFYQDQIANSKNWADKQTEIQNQNTDFAIEKIEQQKEQAQKDYIKEQSGAYVDWQKQSNQYGANAEQMANMGMANTGYSESSQVSMYNTYQNRVAVAREAFVRATLNYDNAIKDAQLQNSAALAEIAYKAYQEQLELSLQGFQYKNSLIIDKANAKREIENTYYGRYQDVLNQINTENALAEQIRQYNEKMAEEKRQYNATLALQQAQLAEEKRQFSILHSSSGGSSGGSKSSSGSIKKSSSSSKSSSSGISKGSSGGSGGELEVNMSSVLELGYGPISASKLNSLVAQGVVEEYEKNGQRYFRKKVKSSGGAG